jgi:tetratricopeptide (TPR) repeat protein
VTEEAADLYRGAKTMPDELPVELHAEIDRLAEEGNALMSAKKYAEAAEVFRRGLELLPAPREKWSATVWFLCGIGDAQWFLGDHEKGIDTWRDALLFGGLGNPFVHLRRGQTLYELGDQKEAANELLRALLLAGQKIFASEDPKYWDFIISVARPPEGWKSWDGWTGVEEGSPVHDWLMDPGVYALRAKTHR